jgi:SAM-dependent methyltransferase
MSLEQGAELQQRVNQFWNERAAGAQGPAHHAIVDDKQRQAWLDALAPLLPPEPADVLDVGTGTGFLAFLLADLGHRVTGIDLSDGMLNDARALVDARGPGTPRPAFRTGDAMDPPFPASSFDVVTNRNVTWTLLDPRRALRNWYALLRPNGRVVAVHHRTMRVGANTPYPVQAALPRLPDATTGEFDVTTNDARFSDSLVVLLGEAGFVDARIVELAAADAADASVGSDHLGWLAVTATRRD